MGLTRRRRFAVSRTSARRAFVRFSPFFAFSLRFVLRVHFSVSLVVIGVSLARIRVFFCAFAALL